jgi:hypothetical protein
VSLAEWASGARPVPVATQGNSPWAVAKARELADLVTRYSARRPRSMQRHLGPSELAVECDRQVVGKLVGEPATNHVTDPWPSFMGTAGHAEMENVLAWENARLGYQRFMSEQRVQPPGPFIAHPGTADCVDLQDKALLDWKFLGKSSMGKLQKPAGPPRKYRGQVWIYAVALMSMGYTVERAALVAWPRTSSSIHDVYVWEEPFGDAAVALLTEVAADTERRKAFAAQLGSYDQWAPAVAEEFMRQVPRAPDHEECFFCPFYRPNAKDGVGCPGPVKDDVRGGLT